MKNLLMENEKADLQLEFNVPFSVHIIEGRKKPSIERIYLSGTLLRIRNLNKNCKIIIKPIDIKMKL